MQRIARTLSVLMVLATLLVPASTLARDIPSPTPPASGELAFVLDVVDGDTIRVDREGGTSERVRYIGIDTPEIAHEPGETAEPWGPEATAANEALVRDRMVLLERDASDTDPYDRLLRYVWVETADSWRMVNGELVAGGLAGVRAYEPDTRHHDWLRQLQQEARDAGRGMYGGEPAQDEDDAESLLDGIFDFLLGG